jgi:Zn-finger nucleic acid-binding protein
MAKIDIPDPRLRCPKDATLMEKMRVGELTVDHCARCGAMWFDPYELDAVLQQKSAATKIDYGTAAADYQYNVHRPTPMLCPRDRSPLVAVPDSRQPHVEIDICKSCGGVLLDSGELKDLSEFTLKERLKAFLQR